ncbi:MAG: tripartite tricarboxylate transporter TctB family protein [Burkholderiales bacterium]|nr:tripartite tricarboxylate transporter TctB family protein [Burkholderiales bacterium]
MKIKSPRDFWAGLMFIAFGLFFLLVAQFNYQMGSAVRMGPGYFPSVLGAILAVLGGIVLFNSFLIAGTPVPKFHFRPVIFVLISGLAFAYLLKPLGLVLATIALVFISAYGGHEFRWKEVAILSAVLVIFSVVVFVKGLTLPFPICPSFVEICPIR